MRVRCPNCHDSTEVDDSTELSAITCASCGSAFSLVGDHTLTYTSGEAKTIGHFELLDEIGVGAFGSVWRARDTDLDRTVAVKIPRKGQLDPQESEQFLREARAAAQLKHPNIVAVHEVGREDGQVYIVSDYVEGLTLADWLVGQQLTSRMAAELVLKIAEALHHAHEQGVIHRDLKPTNIILDRDNEPYIMDFGLARREAGEVTMTMEGKVLGTPAYMSPEQAKGESHSADRRSDVYSLGVILYELLTGHKPFRGNVRMLIRQVIEDDAPSPRRLNSTIPRDLETLCLKCLEKEPRRRYHSARELAGELQRFLTGEPVHAHPITAPVRAWRWCKRNPIVAALGCALAIILLTLSIVSPLIAMKQSRLATNERDARNDAERESQQARAARDDAERMSTVLDRKTQELEKQLRISTVTRLAAQSQAIRGEFPVQSLLLAIEAVEARVGGTVMPVAHETLLNTIPMVGGLPLLGHTNTVRSLAITSDSRRLATGSYDGTVRLWDLAEQPGSALIVLEGHEKPINRIVMSPDDRWLISGCQDGTSRIWDLTADDIASSSTVLSKHKLSISSLAIGPNSRWLATGSWDNTVRLWDLSADEIGASSRELRGHTHIVRSLAISPDGRWLVSGSQDETARIWDLHAEDIESSSLLLSDHQNGVYDLAISQDGLLVTAGKKVRLWDLSANDIRASVVEPPGHDGTAIRSVALSRDSRRLVTGGRDGTTRLWDLDSENLVSPQVLTRHDKEVTSVAISASGRWLATGSDDKTVRVWDLDSPNIPSSLLVLRGHENRVMSVMISPNSRWLVAGSADNTVRLWDLTSADPASSMPVARGHDDRIGSVIVSPNGRRLITGDGNRTLVWRLTGDHLASSPVDLKKKYQDNRYLAISSNRRWLLTGGKESTFLLWDVFAESLEQISLDLPTSEGQVMPLAISSNGHWIVSRSEEGPLSLWKVVGREVIHCRDLPEQSRSILIDPNNRWLLWTSSQYGFILGNVQLLDLENITAPPIVLRGHEDYLTSIAIGQRWVVTGSEDHKVRLWDLSSSNVAALAVELHGHSDRVTETAISPDGGWLVTGSRDNTVRVWDLTAEDIAASSRRLSGHFGEVTALAISADGRLVTGSLDSTARVWHLASENPSIPSIVLRAHDAAIRGVAISSDGRWVVTGSDDRTARVWDLDVQSLLALARRLAGRQLTPEEQRQYSVDQL